MRPRAPYSLLASLVFWAAACFAASAAEPTSLPAMLDEFPGTDPVTLQMRQKDAKEMLDELARQSGVKARANPANLWQNRPSQLLDIDVKGVSYWRAMQEICRTGGLQISGWDREVLINNGGGRFGLTGDGPVSEKGPVMTIGQRIYRTNTADLQTGETRRTCTVNLITFIDPRVRLVAWKPLCVTSAVDDKGNDLRSGATTGVYSDRYNQALAWQINQTIALVPATRTGGTVVELKGYLPAIVVLKTQTIEIADPMTRKQFKQDVGPWTVELTEMKDKRPGQTPKAYQVDVVLQHREKTVTPPNFDVGRLIQLVDARGESLMRQRFEGTSTTSDGRSQASMVFMQQTFNGEQIGPPVKLVIDVPLEMKELGLPFEFRDLLLP